ncbi:hypothetical protein LVO79_07605 [Roseivivax marinus]|jgi:hypothetical protein|nr:hypothetical protein [Roseivivax marinus]UMA66297.1 hypothetical protein LVO79_07605 [Roseivivax marinus]SEL35068.1 hypothetical protein SAMN05444413_10854 [Roseivivax marinus]
MSRIGDQAARLWRNLNPSEPSPSFLLKLWLFMISMFLLGLWLGGGTGS